MSTNTFTSVLSQPTVDNGGLKSKYWITRLLNTGLQFSINESGQHVYSIDKQEYIVNPEIDAAASFEALGFTNDSENNINSIKKALGLRQAGFISPLQSETAERRKGKSSAVNPFERDEKLLTAEEYKKAVIRESLDNSETFTFLFDLAGKDITDSLTKPQLITILHKVQSALLPAEKKEVYKTMQEKEEAEAAKWKTLLDAGFSDFAKTNTGYFANTELSALAAANALDKSGYKLMGNPTVNSDLTLKVFFVEGSIDPLTA